MANVSVLLVEDNPMVGEMLRAAMANYCQVSVINDGADALLRVIETPPDLIVADYTIPGIDGRQLVEKLKSRPGTVKLPIIMMASRTDITEKLKMVQDSLEDFVEKPFFVKEAAARIKKVVDKIALEKMAREAPGESTLRGSLAQMNIMDLFQSLEMGHKSCSLTLSNKGEKCQMFFSEGQVNTGVSSTFWFPDKEVQTGDLVVVYTKEGKASEKLLESGKRAHFFYWGRSAPQWASSSHGVVLLHAPEWQGAGASEV